MDCKIGYLHQYHGTSLISEYLYSYRNASIGFNLAAFCAG
jgi:hypothetical protein